MKKQDNNIEDEQWKDILGYEGNYKISNLGRLKSLKFEKEKILKFNTTKDGYLKCGLTKNGIMTSKQGHQLVAIAFLGHIPSGINFVIDHKDGNRANNKVENLQIVTNRENISTCFRKNKNSVSSRYIGVGWNKSRNKWMACIGFNYRLKNLGCFDTELEAASKYQEALKHVNDGTFEKYLELIHPKFSSKYRGVSYNKTNKNWISYIMLKGKMIYLGRFNSELEAFYAYQNELNRQLEIYYLLNN